MQGNEWLATTNLQILSLSYNAASEQAEDEAEFEKKAAICSFPFSS